MKVSSYMRQISLYILGKKGKITEAEISPELYWDDPELTWKGGGVDTAGITAAAAAAAAAAALAGSCWTAIGLMMCSTVWILPSSIILAGGAAWNMEYWALIAGMATRRDQRHQVCWERVSRASSQRAHSPPSWLCQLSHAPLIRTGSPMCQWGTWSTSTLPAGQSTTTDAQEHGDGLGAACSALYLSPWHGCPRARTLPWIYTAPSDHHHPLSGEECGLSTEMGGRTYCPKKLPAPAAEIEGCVVTSGKKGEVCTTELAGSNWPSLYPVL